MPRSYATFGLDYFDDPAVIALSADADRVYLRLVVSPTVSQAGTGPWQPRQLIRQLPDFDEDRLVAAARELEQARFAYIDTDTEEVFIRPLMRRDGVAQKPNVLASACRAALLVRSRRLRPLIGAELARIARERYADDPETVPAGEKLKGSALAYRTAHMALHQTMPALGGTELDPSTRTVQNGSESFTENHSEPFNENHSPRTPGGSGGGGGRGRVTTEGGTGGEVAREHEPPTRQ
ncbi:hypothetical protein, partial [Dietzia sp. DQ12-76]|uniref:hypothetical protein n=1 Tax=Dietzia sp. DQ12-76 TaxID=1630639 RepID=UPI0035CD261E|nr:hypothetical protein [Dietzia sp. DQ12-76]